VDGAEKGIRQKDTKDFNPHRGRNSTKKQIIAQGRPIFGTEGTNEDLGETHLKGKA